MLESSSEEVALDSAFASIVPGSVVPVEEAPTVDELPEVLSVFEFVVEVVPELLVDTDVSEVLPEEVDPEEPEVLPEDPESLELEEPELSGSVAGAGSGATGGAAAAENVTDPVAPLALC
jgi:hypothetical protein